MSICSIDSCAGQQINGRGWCSKHYMKWYRHGDPLFERPKRVWRTPTHRVWSGMKQRCNDENVKEYPRYGGRGIKYDEKWENYSGFLEDMGERPTGMTLDRIDVNGDYSKDNCRWTTPRVQSNNRRNNIFIEHDGRRLTVSQWEDERGLPSYTIGWRIKNGWSIEDAIDTPLKIYRNSRLN